MVHPEAHLPAEFLAEEHLVLDVDTLLVARAAEGRDRQVEGVVPEVAAVAQDVARADGRNVRDVDVERLGVERELDRLAIGADRQQRRRGAVQEVREELRTEGVAGVGRLAVAGVGPLLDLERPDPGVDDAAGARVAAVEGQFRPAVGEIVVDPRVQFRLLRAGVRERRVRRLEGVVDVADRARERIRAVKARVQLERPPVVDDGGVAHARVEQAAVARVHRLPLHRPVERPEAHGDGRALHLARRLRDDVHDAGHRVRAPDSRRRAANDLDLLDFREVDGKEVPPHEPEEVQVDTAPVNERKLRRRQGAGGAAARDVQVAGGGLGHVDARHGAEQARVVLRRLARQRPLPDHADGCRRVDQLLLDLGGGDDDLLLVAGRLLLGRLGSFLLGGGRLRLVRGDLGRSLAGWIGLRRLGERRGRRRRHEQNAEQHGESTGRHSFLLLSQHRSGWRRGRRPRAAERAARSSSTDMAGSWRLP